MPHAHRPRRLELARNCATRPTQLASRPRERARAANSPTTTSPASTSASPSKSSTAAATSTSPSWSSSWPEWRPCARPSARPAVALLDCRDLGPVPYEAAWELQKRLVDALLAERFREEEEEGGGEEGNEDDDDDDNKKNSLPPRRRRRHNRPVGALILLQHEPVYTLGAGATTENLLFDPGEAFADKEGKKNDDDDNDDDVDEQGEEEKTSSSSSPHLPLPPPPAPLFRVERGGEVTWHGPGQLVLYPILDLRAGEEEEEEGEGEGEGEGGGDDDDERRHSSRRRRRPFLTDLHWYLRALEEVVIEALSRLPSHPLLVSLASAEKKEHTDPRIRLVGEREPGLTGVWVRGAKAAALGVRAARWATYHGLALNVNADLSYFGKIVPCGIEGREVASVVTAWERELRELSEIERKAAKDDDDDDDGNGERNEDFLLPRSWRETPGQGPLVAAAADSLLASFCDVLGVALDPVEVPRELLLLSTSTSKTKTRNEKEGKREELLRAFAQRVVRGEKAKTTSVKSL